MKEKLYYMIGLLVGSNGLHKGYRVINKFTFDVIDIYDNSKIPFNEIDNLEVVTKGGKVEIRCNSGKIDKYTVSDVDSCRIKQGTSVVIGQNSYFTIVDYYGKVALLTRREFMSVIRTVGSDCFANVKMSESTENRSASVGSIKTPFDIFKSNFWSSDFSQKTAYVSYFFDRQLKARLNGIEYVSSLGINPDCYAETVEINRSLLKKLFELSEYNTIPLAKFIVEHISSECILDKDIIAYYMMESKAEIKFRGYSIRRVEEDKSKSFYYDLDAGFQNIYKNSEKLNYDSLPVYNGIGIRVIGNKLKIVGLVGGHAGKPSIRIMFDLEDGGEFNSYLIYIDFIEDAGCKYTTSSDNYEKALRLIDKLEDTTYTIRISKDSDIVLNKLLDIYEKIYSLDGYLNIGTSLYDKKPVDFDKEQLKTYGLTIAKLEELFLLLGMTKYSLKDLSKKAELLTVILLNRYEYIKLYSTNRIKIPKIKDGEWRTSNISKSNHYDYVLEFYKDGNPVSQFVMYTDRMIFKSDGLNIILKRILHAVLPINPLYAKHAREKEAVNSEIMDGLNNVGKYIVILSANIFTKYNPFPEEIQQLRYFTAEKKEDFVSACWDYGVSIVNGGYYIYIKATHKATKLSKDEQNLMGLLDKDVNNDSKQVLAIPILRFKTYEDMYNFYNKVFMGNDSKSALWVEPAIKFANLLLRHKGALEKPKMSILQELYEGLRTQKGISKESIEKLAHMSFEETGIIL